MKITEDYDAWDHRLRISELVTWHFKTG